MPSIIPALTLLLLGLLPVAADALAQSAPSHAPIITRPVAADFPSETFTLFWRPATINTGAAPTEYHIYREQNAAADRAFTAHPTHCDTVDFSVRLTAYTFTVTLGHPQIYQYTASPRNRPTRHHTRKLLPMENRRRQRKRRRTRSNHSPHPRTRIRLKQHRLRIRRHTKQQRRLVPGWPSTPIRLQLQRMGDNMLPQAIPGPRRAMQRSPTGRRTKCRCRIIPRL